MHRMHSVPFFRFLELSVTSTSIGQTRLHLPQDGLFRRFAQLHPAARQIKIGRAVVVHSEDFPVRDHHRADAKIELAPVCDKG